MNEFLRAVARECGVPVSLLRDMVQCVGSRLLSCHCGVDFCGRGATLVTARETNASPLKLTGAVAHQGGRSGRWWTTFEETAAQPCVQELVPHSACTCRTC